MLSLGAVLSGCSESITEPDEVEVVTTVIHELSHQHLFVPGQVTFNESFATFVGRVGAARYFCTRAGGGPDSIKCRRALARWRDGGAAQSGSGA